MPHPGYTFVLEPFHRRCRPQSPGNETRLEKESRQTGLITVESKRICTLNFLGDIAREDPAKKAAVATPIMGRADRGATINAMPSPISTIPDAKTTRS